MNWANNCDAGCDVPEDTCNVGGCPGIYCPGIDGVINENVVDPAGNSNQSCITRQCAATAGTAWTPPQPACGPWSQWRWDPCNNGKSCAIENRSGCNGGASSSICGGSGCCGRSPSCTGAFIDFDFREVTGNAIREPIVRFEFNSLSIQPFDDCTNSTVSCDWHDEVTYKCTLNLPDGCSRDGKVRVIADIEGHAPVDRLFDYRDQTSAGVGYRTAYALDVAYTATGNTQPGHYIRLANASFSHRRPSASLPNLMPHAPASFDGLDIYPLTKANYAFSTGDGAGLVTGLNLGVGVNMKYSRTGNARLTDYARTNMDIDALVSRMLTQKSTTDVSSNPNVNVASGNMYRLPVSGSATNSFAINRVNVNASGGSPGAVLMSLFQNGPAGSGSFILAGAYIQGNITTADPVAIIADTITIDQSVTQINAILIAKNIIIQPNTAPNNNRDAARLRINGNLIAQNNFSQGRTLADTGRPALLVNFEAMKYVQLLPLLSLYDEIPYTEL